MIDRPCQGRQIKDRYQLEYEPELLYLFNNSAPTAVNLVSQYNNAVYQNSSSNLREYVGEPGKQAVVGFDDLVRDGAFHNLYLNKNPISIVGRFQLIDNLTTGGNELLYYLGDGALVNLIVFQYIREFKVFSCLVTVMVGPIKTIKSVTAPIQSAELHRIYTVAAIIETSGFMRLYIDGFQVQTEANTNNIALDPTIFPFVGINCNNIFIESLIICKKQLSPYAIERMHTEPYHYIEQ